MQKGIEGERIVKRSLWQRNFRVKDVSRYTHYDLLVENKYRVEVKTFSPTERVRKRYIPLRLKEFDVLCVVLFSPVKNTIHYIRKSDLKAVAPRKGYSSRLNESAAVITVDALKRHFTTRPEAIFTSTKPRRNAKAHSN